MNILTQFPIKNVSDGLCLPNQVHSVARLMKELGREKVGVILEAYIYDYTDFVNPVRNMTAMQIKTTADLIIDEFFNLKIPEIALVFKNAKAGKYKSIYEGIDGAKILGWFREYFNERLDVAESMSDREHKMSKLETTTYKLGLDIIQKAYEAHKSTPFEPQPFKLKLTKQEEDEAYRKFKENYKNKTNE